MAAFDGSYNGLSGKSALSGLSALASGAIRGPQIQPVREGGPTLDGSIYAPAVQPEMAFDGQPTAQDMSDGAQSASVWAHSQVPPHTVDGPVPATDPTSQIAENLRARLQAAGAAPADATTAEAAGAANRSAQAQNTAAQAAPASAWGKMRRAGRQRGR
jgi:hypothetical protein